MTATLKEKPLKTSATSHPWRALNQQTVCHIMDVSSAQLNDWLSDGAPVSMDDMGNKVYDVAKLWRWHRQQQKLSKR